MASASKRIIRCEARNTGMLYSSISRRKWRGVI
jgi:hypothetical protein